MLNVFSGMQPSRPGIPGANWSVQIGGLMISPARVNAVRKLAIAGDQAGLSLEQMIQLLNAGMSVVGLLDLITWRLDYSAQGSPEWLDHLSCGGA